MDNDIMAAQRQVQGEFTLTDRAKLMTLVRGLGLIE